MKTPSPPSRLMAVLFTDIAGSVALKSRLGTAAYSEMVSRHDALFHEIVGRSEGGEIMNDTGDGFFARFASTSEAVNAALRFQHALHAKMGESKDALRVRIGLHVGEIAELRLDGQGRPKLIGLAADIAARIMSLALPGQILMSRAAFDEARQYVREHPAPIEANGAGAPGAAPELQWIAHGPYLFKGADDPTEVFEVGAKSIAPLQAPPDSEKVRRAVPAGQEEVLGWRPAAGLEIPRREQWFLERKIGEGGFGEVWLAVHARTRARRVFKFCFDVDRLRSFKRELTLFRLLRETLGERPDIAPLLDIQLEQPPFFLESEFTEAGNLKEWCAAQGGADAVALETRIELVAGAADAVAAAHSIGVLHKDLKPSNILIYTAPDGTPKPQLADFGIGALTDVKHAQERDVTITGFTESLLESESGSRTGTRMYTPPETLAGEVFSIQGDVYSLGVVLYQIVIGDFNRPLAQGWERDVADPLLREDIAKCVAGRREERFGSAAELAQGLRDLPRRARAHKRRNLLRLAAIGGAAVVVLLGASAIMLAREHSLRRQAESAEANATATTEFLKETLKSVDPLSAGGREVTVVQMLGDAATKLGESMKERPEVEADLRHTIGETYFGLGKYDESKAQLASAVEIRSRVLGERDPLTMKSMDSLGGALLYLGELDEAERFIGKALALRTEGLGPEHQETLVSMSRMALVLQDRGDYEKAEQMHRDVLALKQRTLGADHRETLETMASMADLLEDAGKLEDAERTAREGAELAAKALGETDPSTLGLQSIYASILSDMGRYEESEALSAKVAEVKTRLFGEDHPETLTTQNVRALTLEYMKRYDEGAALLRRMVELAEQTLGPEHHSTLTYLGNLGRIEQLRGNLDEAERILRRVHEHHLAHDGENAESTLFLANNLALLLLDRQKPEEAEPLFRRVVTGLDQLLEEGHWIRSASRVNLAQALKDLRRFEEAEKEFLTGYEGLLAALGPEHNRPKDAADSIADLYKMWDKADLEAEWRAKSK